MKIKGVTKPKHLIKDNIDKYGHDRQYGVCRSQKGSRKKAKGFKKRDAHDFQWELRTFNSTNYQRILIDSD